MVWHLAGGERIYPGDLSFNRKKSEYQRLFPHN